MSSLLSIHVHVTVRHFSIFVVAQYSAYLLSIISISKVSLWVFWRYWSMVTLNHYNSFSIMGLNSLMIFHRKAVTRSILGLWSMKQLLLTFTMIEEKLWMIPQAFSFKTISVKDESSHVFGVHFFLSMKPTSHHFLIICFSSSGGAGVWIGARNGLLCNLQPEGNHQHCLSARHSYLHPLHGNWTDWVGFAVWIIFLTKDVLFMSTPTKSQQKNLHLYSFQRSTGFVFSMKTQMRKTVPYFHGYLRPGGIRAHYLTVRCQCS